MAYCSRVASRFSNFAAATAAPMPAVMPVCDHATVPARRRHRDRLRQPARHLDAKRDRQQQVGAADRPPLCQCQRRGGDRTRRMHHGLGVRVVVRVDAGCQAIDQTGVQRIGLVAAADHRGMWVAAVFAQRRVGQLYHLMPCTADRAAHNVDERAKRLAPHVRWQIGPARRHDIIGQPCGNLAGCIDECVGHEKLLVTANASRRRRCRSRRL